MSSKIVALIAFVLWAGFYAFLVLWCYGMNHHGLGVAECLLPAFGIGSGIFGAMTIWEEPTLLLNPMFIIGAILCSFFWVAMIAAAVSAVNSYRKRFGSAI